MGYKSRKNDSDDAFSPQLIDKLRKIMNPLFDQYGIIDLHSFEGRSDLEYVLALLLNSIFMNSKDKNYRRFGADDVVALKIEVEKNIYLKYWGKINWLAKPKEHQCHRSFQDPFYGFFKIENEQLKLIEIKFGDYDLNDLDGDYWITTEMNWIYTIS